MLILIVDLVFFSSAQDDQIKFHFQGEAAVAMGVAEMSEGEIFLSSLS